MVGLPVQGEGAAGRRSSSQHRLMETAPADCGCSQVPCRAGCCCCCVPGIQSARQRAVWAVPACSGTHSMLVTVSAIAREV